METQAIQQVPILQTLLEANSTTMRFPDNLHELVSTKEANTLAYNAIMKVYNDRDRKNRVKAYMESLGTPQWPTFPTPEHYSSYIFTRGTEKAKRENWKVSFFIEEHLQPIFKELVYYFGGFQEQCKVIKPHHKMIIIQGPVGTGKTELLKLFAANPQQSYSMVSSLSINNEAMAKDAYTSTVNKYTHMISTHNRGGSQQYFGQKEVGLFIDDFGTEEDLNLYGNKKSVIAEIILERYMNLKNHGITTLISTNLDNKEIGKKYGARVFDRIKEQAVLFKIDPQTKSFRSRKAENV